MCTVRYKQAEMSDSADDDDDDDDDDVVVASSSEQTGGDPCPLPRRHSADDRPITPMKNQMLYSMMLTSHQFADGVLR